ncbi:NAD-dependent epimerase/dehydratase family protein [Chengkuizengella axinellae]|uniref:NAD-dependent epimerase/dehydratase family protein n=1 Tax=Chengkuizengella axinellae TaxID=3064388 RepID=A0ABT9J1B2_9BACL|nr:NAD-dependent epimerase/dehydratase family protein [Chengkuizengella sp. 2205SS18-9]MDP5275392.1 NAD-dependent epimerase/dehydratase family protein [Chengkuizengella sp. 2205SS18-9]
MKILIIGGTRFLGRYLVSEALAKGHEITLFNRGNHQHGFENVEQLIGDRSEQLDILKNRKWDAVIDTCGYVPRDVYLSTKTLADQTEHYTYISSISVYKDWILEGIDENYAVHTLSKKKLEQITRGGSRFIPEYYGALKYMSEKEAENNLVSKLLTIRPGLIVGKYDYSDRFTYWVDRIGKGGKVLTPGDPNQKIQLIDAKDLASWNLDMIEKKETGTFNATGINRNLTMLELLETCREVTNSDAEFVWGSESFLLEHNVKPWSDMPLWIPSEHPLEGEEKPWKGSNAFNIDKAIEKGLTFRPLEETIEDLHKWNQLRDKQINKAGITLEKEKQLLRELAKYSV